VTGSVSMTCSRRRKNKRPLARVPVYRPSVCIVADATYSGTVPKLWNETVEAHRRAVRDATLDATAALVAEHGLAPVTMSQIAETTSIGRATLYKHFPDIEAFRIAWHDRQVTGHLEQLAEVRDRAGDARARLEAVLEAYALICHGRPATPSSRHSCTAVNTWPLPSSTSTISCRTC